MTRAPAAPALVLGMCLAALLLTADAADAAARVRVKKKHKAQPKPAATVTVDTRPIADTPGLAPDSQPTLLAMGVPPEPAGDTPSIDTTGTDTEPQDTRPYSARAGGCFYHKRTFGHAPREAEKNVTVSADTDSLSPRFDPCPICFQEAITEEDFELEEAIANQVSGIVEFRYRKLNDDKIAGRLDRLGRPMIPILDRKHLEFFFTPLRSSLEKNAISAGNGNIYFTTGLLDILEDDDEVAAVLAHEIMHAEFRHVLQDFKLSQKLTLITALASAILNKSASFGGIFQVLQDYAVHLVMNGFSRQFELEADAGAKWILATLGQDTSAMRRVLLKLDDLSRDRPERPAILQTHPDETDRIKAFDETLIFNEWVRTDTLSMRLKFQRPRVVGWFKERAVPALYASLVNESDTPVIVSDFEVKYAAADLPDVKLEIDPSKAVIPQRSYVQIKILVIARKELDRRPDALDFSCVVRPLDEEVRRDAKTRKKIEERVSFHFKLAP
ncbi:M48 family metalloprotease [bacterium]|nr:M48 family metalloprotease [bacterium]